MASAPQRTGLRAAWIAAIASAVAVPPSSGGEAAGPAAAPAAKDREAALEALLASLEKQYGEKLNAPREDARLLHLLVKMTGAKRALEVGTSYGYTALWLARALETTGGTLVTVEIDPDRVKAAHAALARAGFAGRVTCLTGDAHAVVRTLDGPFDFILLDADKGGEIDYFRALFPKLERGGVIAVHNAIRFRDNMKEYLDAVAAHPELDTVTLSAGGEDGYCVSRRRGPAGKPAEAPRAGD